MCCYWWLCRALRKCDLHIGTWTTIKLLSMVKLCLFLDIWHKWDHVAYGLLCLLLSLSVRSCTSCYVTVATTFLLLSSNASCGHDTFSLSVPRWWTSVFAHSTWCRNVFSCSLDKYDLQVGSLDLIMFNLLGSCQIVCWCGNNILYSCLRCTKVQVSEHDEQ